jgi:hypothetical protein
VAQAASASVGALLPAPADAPRAILSEWKEKAQVQNINSESLVSG